VPKNAARESESAARPPAKGSSQVTIRFLAVIGIGICLFVLPFALADHITSASVDLVKNFIGPFVIVSAIILYRPDINAIVLILTDRINKGDAFEIGLLKLGESAKRIPEPAVNAEVTAANIAILHTSWYSSKWTAKLQAFSPGRYYRFDAVLIAPSSVLDSITKVTYYLGSDGSFPEGHRVQEFGREARDTRYRLEDCANGTFILRAVVEFENETLTINRFIDLQESGPRIPGPRVMSIA
jgi:hypothetical protein